jgi:hypothetical protein
MASALEKGKPMDVSDDEKITDQGQEYVPPANELADPDAGLSEEERAAHVRMVIPENSLPSADNNTGPQTPLETRHQAHTMAVFLVSDLLPGSDQHRQCED